MISGADAVVHLLPPQRRRLWLGREAVSQVNVSLTVPRLADVARPLVPRRLPGQENPEAVVEEPPPAAWLLNEVTTEGGEFSHSVEPIPPAKQFEVRATPEPRHRTE